MALAESSSTDVVGARAQFPQTLWSVVLTAGSRDKSSEAADALAALCRAYWQPIYSFLRRQGKSPHDAEDLTQAFFLHLFQRNALETVSPEKGKFRSFLLAALKHFIVDEWEKSRAQKRGGGVAPVSIDADDAESHYQLEAKSNLDPEKMFERRWAITLMERVLQRLEGENRDTGKAERFEQLKVFLLGEPGGPKYADVARELQMSEGAVKVAVLRLRHRFGEIFRAEVANTVAAEDDIEAELRHIIQLLATR
jgi:RNA polymerase sigma factor (sigma-70 family)